MEITTNGQVTIPEKFRKQLGWLPYAEVEFALAGEWVQIRQVRHEVSEDMGRRVRRQAPRTRSESGMSTDQILAAIRDGGKTPKRRRSR